MSTTAETAGVEPELVGRLPRGIVASSVTTCSPEGELDLSLLPAHIDWLVAEGVHGISPLGSSGEFVALSSEDRRRVLEAAIAAVNGRVPVLAGTHHYATAETIALSRHAERAGADALLIVPPYYMRPTVAQVLDHYRRVADAVAIPIVLYHNATGSAVDIPTDGLVQLVDEGAIAGVKMSNPDPERIRSLLAETAGSCRVYVGIDTVAFEGLCHGAHGWISGIPSIVPRVARRLYEAIALHADLGAGRAQWSELAPLMRLQFEGYLGRGVGPQWLSVAKAALNLIGPQVGAPIPPLQPLSPEDVDRLAKILARLGYGVTTPA